MKKILVFTLAFALVLGNGFMMFEGVVASAANETVTSTSAAVDLDHLVTTNITAELSLTCDTATVALGDINGMTGGTGTGSTLCNVSTNADAGYTLKLQAGDDGLRAGATTNYIDPISDGAFSVAATASGVGYNVSSSLPADTSWFGLSSVQDTIATSAGETAVAGVNTTIYYRVEVGANKNQAVGLYDTLVTYTAS